MLCFCKTFQLLNFNVSYKNCSSLWHSQELCWYLIGKEWKRRCWGKWAQLLLLAALFKQACLAIATSLRHQSESHIPALLVQKASLRSSAWGKKSYAFNTAQQHCPSLELQGQGCHSISNTSSPKMTALCIQMKEVKHTDTWQGRP